MTERKPQRNRRGFTLTEVLLALAILIILLALVMIPVSRHQRNIRQSELDSEAETLSIWRLRTASPNCRPAAAATSTARTGPRP